MLFRKSPDKFWDIVSSRYAASPIPNRPAYENKIRKIKSCLSAEHVVMDVGCGTGTQCGDIADHVKQVTGIDISSKLLAIAEQKKSERKQDNIEFIRTTVFDERFKPGSFDVVMAFYVLHFCEDIETVLRRIHDLLKPDGLFVSETACLGENNKLIGNLLRFAGHLGIMPKMNLLTTAKLELALARTGFSIVDKTRFSELSAEYTLSAKKTCVVK